MIGHNCVVSKYSRRKPVHWVFIASSCTESCQVCIKFQVLKGRKVDVQLAASVLDCSAVCREDKGVNFDMTRCVSGAMCPCVASDGIKADVGPSESMHHCFILWSCDAHCTDGESRFIVHYALALLSLTTQYVHGVPKLNRVRGHP